MRIAVIIAFSGPIQIPQGAQLWITRQESLIATAFRNVVR
jgi:hypothetical protein